MQWQDNLLTVEGKQLHERVDDPFFTETRNGTVIARAVPVASYTARAGGRVRCGGVSPRFLWERGRG